MFERGSGLAGEDQCGHPWIEKTFFNRFDPWIGSPDPVDNPFQDPGSFSMNNADFQPLPSGMGIENLHDTVFGLFGMKAMEIHLDGGREGRVS